MNFSIHTPFIISNNNARLLQKFLEEEREREARELEEKAARAAGDFECNICHKSFPFGHEHAIFLDVLLLFISHSSLLASVC